MSTIPSSDTGMINQYRKAVQEMETNHSRETKKKAEEHNRELESLKENYQQSADKKDKAAQGVIQRVKDESLENLEKERQNYGQNIDKITGKLNAKQTELNDSIPRDQHTIQLEKMDIEGKRRDSLNKDNFKSLEDEQAHRLKHLAGDTSRRIENLTRDHSKEVSQLSDELAELHSYDKTLEHQKAIEIAAGRKENHDSYKTEVRHLEDAYEGTLNRVKQDLENKEDEYIRKNQSLSKGREEQYTDLIRKGNVETRQQIQDVQNAFAQQIKQLELGRKNEEQKSAEHLESKTNEITRQNRMTMENQAKNYGETINRIRSADQDQIQNLEKALQTQRTTSDTSQLSPAADAAVRKYYTLDYDKKLQAEVERDTISRDETRDRFMTDYTTLREDFERKETELHQANADEKTNDRLYYFGSLQEIEDLSKAKIREEAKSHSHETETLIKRFGNVMERQRKDYEHILQTVKADAESKLTNFQKESEISSKTAQRTFTIRQNEIIREYDEKLANQKIEFEAKLGNLKAENQNDIRDSERKAKKELDMQSLGYEQRIAQIDAQNNEKEQSITRSFQNELDKVRRNYELLSQKKS